MVSDISVCRVVQIMLWLCDHWFSSIYFSISTIIFHSSGGASRVWGRVSGSKLVGSVLFKLTIYDSPMRVYTRGGEETNYTIHHWRRICRTSI
jgi:hypothetical protein